MIPSLKRSYLYACTFDTDTCEGAILRESHKVRGIQLRDDEMSCLSGKLSYQLRQEESCDQTHKTTRLRVEQQGMGDDQNDRSLSRWDIYSDKLWICEPC